MTLRQQVEMAAFWHERVCVGCGSTVEYGDETEEELSPCCEEPLIQATQFVRLLETMERDSEGEGN